MRAKMQREREREFEWAYSKQHRNTDSDGHMQTHDDAKTRRVLRRRQPSFFLGIFGGSPSRLLKDGCELHTDELEGWRNKACTGRPYIVS